MGKRELLLILAFVVAGVIVYQVTAPPGKPGEGGFSAREVFAGMRRAIHGNRGHAEVTHATVYPVDAGTAEIRLTGPFNELTVQGEERADIASNLRITSNGFDDNEARRLADASVLQVDDAGTSVNFQVKYPEEGNQTGSLTLKVPKHLRVRIEQSGSRTLVANVAAAELAGSRGDTTVRQVAGRVTLTHRGGRVTIEDVQGLKLVSRAGAYTRITRVAGDVSLDVQGGEVQTATVKGAIDAESRSAELKLKVEGARGPIRINANGGRVSVENAKSDLRVDARNSDVDVAVAEGAPSIAIYEEGGEDVHVTPPPGGYRLDAVAADGHVSVPEKTLTVATNGSEQRAVGPVNGGGPTITVRSREGDIVIRGR